MGRGRAGRGGAGRGGAEFKPLESLCLAPRRPPLPLPHPALLHPWLQVMAFWAKAERVVNYKVYVAVQERKRQVRRGSGVTRAAGGSLTCGLPRALGCCWATAGRGTPRRSRGRPRLPLRMRAGPARPRFLGPGAHQSAAPAASSLNSSLAPRAFDRAPRPPAAP
jgi:hypothetical protein